MFLGFGEVMMRVAPDQKLRLRQVLPGSVEVTWGGGEANVCASLAMYGQQARYVSALPDNALSASLISSLRGLGVDTSQILQRDGRLGIYFVEVGANLGEHEVVREAGRRREPAGRRDGIRHCERVDYAVEMVPHPSKCAVGGGFYVVDPLPRYGLHFVDSPARPGPDLIEGFPWRIIVGNQWAD